MGLPALLTTIVLVAAKRLGGVGANMGKSELVTHNGALVVRRPWDSTEGSTEGLLCHVNPRPSPVHGIGTGYEQ